MHGSNRREAEELFQQVVSLTAEERRAYLEENCRDAALRSEVEKLLKHNRVRLGNSTLDVIPDAPAALIGESAPGRGALRIPNLAGSTPPTPGFDHGQFMPGTVIRERYRIVGLLGRGGMGEVYRADDLELGQSVALKFLPARLATHEDGLQRFRNEVRLARQISHPNVCRVYDIGQVDSHWYLSMEYVDGEDLSLLLRRIGRFSKDRAVDVARQLCLGLEAAHEKGVLHRDLKPANVMIDGRGKVRITDFGLAAVPEAVGAEDVRSGTPQYMAPEQLTGREVTRRSDIYSLGLVLHEVFTGKPVWEADTLAELYRKRKESSSATPSSHVDDLDPQVERVIQGCLEPDPRNRPASALAVAAALPGGDPLSAALAAGETPSPELVAASGGSFMMRPGVVAGLLCALLAGLVIRATHPNIEQLSQSLPMAPEFLVREAQVALAALGYAPAEQAPRRFNHGFRLVPENPAEIEFWYRESPRRLYATRWGRPRVDWDDPPMIEEGMIGVTLDSRGKIRTLKVVSGSSMAGPPGPEGLPGRPAAPDWRSVFHLAGLELDAYVERPDASWIPPVYADRLWSWDPVEKGPAGAHIEAATLRDKVVYLDARSALRTGGGSSVPESHYSESLFETMTGVLFLIMSLVAAAIVPRSLGRGRADRRGAFRLAIFFFSVRILVWILGGTHNPEVAPELQLIFNGLSFSIWQGLMMWIFYIALEPYVRKLWPESLITWTRLIGGRLRDAAIGRDILVGGAFLGGWMALGRCKEFLDDGLGLLPDPPTNLLLTSLSGGRFFAESIIFLALKAVGDGIFFLLFLFVLRVLLRKSWVAITAFTLIWSFLWCYGRIPTSWLSAVPVFASIAFLITRYGLFACMVALFFLYVIIGMPITASPDVWYWDASLYCLLIILGTTAYGLWTGQRKIAAP